MGRPIALPASSALSDDEVLRLATASPRQAAAWLRGVPASQAASWAVQLADAVPVRARQHPAHGRQLARLSHRLARRTKQPLVIARALRAQGHAHALGAEYRRALTRYTRAAALFARGGDRLQVAITESGTLQTLIYLGAYAQAHQAARRARRTFARAGDTRRLARLDSNVGNIFFRQDRFEQALACYQRAETSMRALGEHHDTAIALRNMAVCLTSLGRFDESARTYRDARTFGEAHGLHVLVGEADYNVAYLHFLCGEYERALGAYAEARRACDRLDDRYHRALCDLDEAEVCLELNDHANGRRLAEQAAAQFARLEMRYERAKALTFLATALLRLGDDRRASAEYRRARALFAADDNAPWVAAVDLARAGACLHRGKDLDARRILRHARRRVLAPTTRVQWSLLRARLALRAGRPREARLAATDAVRRLTRLQAPSLDWQAHAVRGEALEACGDRAGARRSYQQARGALEGLRTHLTQDRLRIAFLIDKTGVYERLMCLALADRADRERDARALQIIEDAKSRSLVDLLAFKAAELPARVAAAGPAVDAVRTLEHEVRAFERQMADEAMKARPDTRRVRRLRAAAAGRLRRLSASLGSLAATDADLASLHTGSSANVEAIRGALPASTVLLEYFVAAGAVYAAIVTPDRVSVRPLGALAPVAACIQLLRFQLAKFQLGPDYLRTFSATLSAATHRHLEELYAALVAPVRSALTGPALVIVPHGPLHYVPFHALSDGRRYLMQDYAVSYAPSGTVYRLCQTRPPSSRSGSVVMALDDHLAPHIRREAEEVAAILPAARLYLGDAATRETLRDEGATARYLHVATHGFFRRDNPMLSSIRLAGGDLSLADLYALALPAELVTLSGCGTGLSAVVGGDELIGLTRGLLHAGARSLLLTMWQVDDVSTAVFMTAFYRYLMAGQTKAEAGAHAMEDVRQRFPHPYYWAPFVLIGHAGAAERDAAAGDVGGRR